MSRKKQGQFTASTEWVGHFRSVLRRFFRKEARRTERAAIRESSSDTGQAQICCVVANVVSQSPYGPGGVEVRAGTRHFRPGAKLHIIDPFGGMCDRVIAIFLIVGSALYLTGTLVVTIVCNVPRNNLLAAVSPTDSKSADIWAGYVAEWTAWNHVRTIASPAAAASFRIALVL